MNRKKGACSVIRDIAADALCNHVRNSRSLREVLLKLGLPAESPSYYYKILRERLVSENINFSEVYHVPSLRTNTTHDCEQCGKTTRNPKYCSRSCCAIASNRVRKRIKTGKYREPDGSCFRCHDEIKGEGGTKRYCKKCNPNYVDWSGVTRGDVHKGRSTFQANARIRALARKAYKASDKPRHCMMCDYRNHYEVCHVRPVADFPMGTTIAEINRLDNLIALCPNCHWDFDHGLLDVGI